MDGLPLREREREREKEKEEERKRKKEKERKRKKEKKERERERKREEEGGRERKVVAPFPPTSRQNLFLEGNREPGPSSRAWISTNQTRQKRRQRGT